MKPEDRIAEVPVYELELLMQRLEGMVNPTILYQENLIAMQQDLIASLRSEAQQAKSAVMRMLG